MMDRDSNPKISKIIPEIQGFILISKNSQELLL